MFYYCTGMISYLLSFSMCVISCDFLQSLSGGAIKRFLLRYISFFACSVWVA